MRKFKRARRIRRFRRRIRKFSKISRRQRKFNKKVRRIVKNTKETKYKTSAVLTTTGLPYTVGVNEESFLTSNIETLLNSIT